MTTTAGQSRASGHYIRKRLRSAGFARRLAAFSALCLVVGLIVYRLGGVDFEAIKAILVVILAMAGIALAVALAGLARVWRSGHEGGGRAIGAAGLSLFVMAPFAFVGILALENPPTRVAVTDGMLAADVVSAVQPSEPPAAPATEGAEPVISGRRFQATAAQVYAVARIVLVDMGWTVLDVSAGLPTTPEEPETTDLGTSGTVEIAIPTPRSENDLAAANDPMNQPESDEYAVRAVAEGPILALPSDVTVRIVEDGVETFVDLRSTSRVVAWDLGQNRRFIEDFLARLDVAMAGVQSVVPDAES